MTNEFGLDYRYFRQTLKIIVARADRYKPEEMARALTRLAYAADHKEAKAESLKEDKHYD